MASNEARYYKVNPQNVKPSSNSEEEILQFITKRGRNRWQSMVINYFNIISFFS